MENYRKILLFVIGTAAVLSSVLSSCTIGGVEIAGCDIGSTKDKEMQTLTVKLSGIIPSTTRAVESQASGSSSAIALDNGHIYIIDPGGLVTYNTPLNVNQAAGSGQILSKLVPEDSRVFILGNIPPGISASSLNSLDAIISASSAVSTQTDYRRSVLANRDFSAVGISTVGQGRATVAVTVKPVISRLELLQLRGNNDIKGFTVTGVFLDSYYPRFTFGGGHAGTIFSQNSSTVFSGTGDTNIFTAVATSGRYIARPTADRVWAYNVAAGGKPRLIVRMTNIQYIPHGATSTTDLGSAVRYLTLQGYSGMSNFKPGEIYRITTLDFGYAHLATTPNGSDIDLDVSVIDVIDWDIVNPGVVVDKQ